MNEKSEPSESAASASGSSMKVNVMYRGIVYRVRGIKVLCSVVTAVILLLVAIVGLGVWMLVSAYAEEKAEPFDNNVNATAQAQGSKDTENPLSTPSTIDFNAPSVILEDLPIAEQIPISHSDDDHVNEAVGHFQAVTPSRDLTAPSHNPSPDPTFGLFDGLLELRDKDSEGTTPVADTPPDFWRPIDITHESDSIVEHSESEPVVVPFPSDRYSEYREGASEFAHNSNRRVDDFPEDNIPKYPLQGGLPDNIPRDIDPALLDMGLPFPYPPSLSTTLALPSSTTPMSRRPSNLHHYVDLQHSPTETLRRQHSLPPLNSRPPYTYHAVYDPPQPDDYSDQPAHDPPERYDYSEQTTDDHDQPYQQSHEVPQQTYEHYYEPSLQGSRLSYQPLTLREAPTEISEAFPGMSDNDNSQKYNAKRGEQISQGFTMPPGIKIPEGIMVPTGVTIPAGFKIPTGMTLPEGVTVPENLENLRNSEGEKLDRVRLGSAGYFEDMMYYYNKHERKATNISEHSSTPEESQYSQRKGLTQEDPGYSGPPVVGYSDRVHATERSTSDPVFQYFWDAYHHNGKPPAEHDDRGPVPEEASTQSWRSPPPRRQRPRISAFQPNSGGARPKIRGLLPNGQGNRPLPSRLDAERPPVQIPNRSLWVDQNNRPPPQTTARPDHKASTNHRPLLGPLYDIYEYSQRLASTLLSFPAKIDSRFNESRKEYMQNEVELLEDYNKVFKEADTTSADVLPDMFDNRPGRNERLMLLDSEKLRALNPFELSLITWTFLDFWEFLIEKVGTLSKEDLQLLELRLERLRQNKDRVLTQNFMKATVNEVSQASDRSFPELSHAITMVEDLLESLPEVEKVEDTDTSSSHDVVEGRMWDPLGMFSSEQRVKFMEFAIKVLFKFGRVYLKKRYALDCMMLLFCKDLNANTKKRGMDGMAAKIKSVGLKVLIERENRQMDTIGEIWRSLTAWETLQCDVMFPKCDGPKALEIVNDVALGSRK
nr:uncharacterized protein LOC128695379 [Cherax quadricarinatus]